MAKSRARTVERIWGALMGDQTIVVGDDLDTRVELYEVWGSAAEHLVRDKQAVVELVDRFWGTPGLTFVVFGGPGLVGFRAYATFAKPKAAERWADGRAHRGIWVYDWKRERWIIRAHGSRSVR